MFCKNCGAELNEKAGICKNCGWEPTIEEVGLMEEINQVENSASVEEFGQKETTNLTEKNIQNEAAVEIGDPLYTYNHNALKKHISQLNLSGFISGKKKWIIVAVVIISLIVAISITNSDSYRIDKATDYILKGNTSAGLKKISSIYTQQAEVIRGFAAVEDAKNVFEAYCDTKNDFGVSNSSISTDKDAVNDFINAVNTFNENNKTAIYLLPSELREKAEYYQKVCESINDAEAQSSVFSNLMSAHQNEFERNEVNIHPGVMYTVGSRYFTLNQLSDRVDITNTAYEKFKNSTDHFEVIDVSKDDKENIDFSTSCFTDFMLDANAFADDCKNEADSETNFIDNASESWDRTEQLNMNSPDKDFSVVIIADLPTVNAETFKDIPSYMSNCLQFNLLRYYLFEAQK